MKKRVVSLTILNILTSCLVIGTINAQWVKIGGPWGGNSTYVKFLTTCNNNLFAGHWGYGVHLSTDSGKTWNEIGNGLKSSTTRTLATVNGTTVFAGFERGYLFCTSDNGVHWKEVDKGIVGDELKCLSGSGALLFAGTNYGGFVSTDSGEHWEQVFSQTQVQNALVDGTTIYAGTDDGIYRSIDSGSSWTTMNKGISKYTTTISKMGKILLVGTHSGVYRSIDSGSNWTSSIPSQTDTTVTCFLVKGPTLFAGANNKYGQGNIYRSNDSGLTWTPAGGGSLPLNAPVQSLAVLGNKLFACNDSGVYCSSNNGDSWTHTDTDLRMSTIKSITKIGENIIAGTSSGIVHSSDNGTRWSVVNPAIVNITAAGNSLVFAGSDSGLLRSTDYGLHWTIDSTSLKKILSFSLSGSSFLAGVKSIEQLYPAGSTCTGIGSKSLFESKDSGKTWNVFSNSLPHTCQCFGPNSTDCRYSSPGVQSITKLGRFLFTAVPGSGVYVSADNGTNWKSPNLGDADGRVNCLEVINGNVLFGTFNSGIYCSTDSGTTWGPADSGLTNLNVQCLLTKGTTIFAGTRGGGVFYSNNVSRSWSEMNDGLTQMNIYSLTADDKYLYAGTGDLSGRIWKFKLPEVTVQKSKGIRIKQAFYKLTFNTQSISLEFSLSHAEQVALNIYSLSGRLVAVFANGRFEAGKHIVRLNTRDLAIGCYTIKCKAGMDTQIFTVPILR